MTHKVINMMWFENILAIWSVLSFQQHTQTTQSTLGHEVLSIVIIADSSAWCECQPFFLIVGRPSRD